MFHDHARMAVKQLTIISGCPQHALDGLVFGLVLPCGEAPNLHFLCILKTPMAPLGEGMGGVGRGGWVGGVSVWCDPSVFCSHPSSGSMF